MAKVVLSSITVSSPPRVATEATSGSFLTASATVTGNGALPPSST